jgi:hypothetical protein
VASSKEAEKVVERFYDQLKSTGERAKGLDKHLKSTYAANLILLNALKKIEDQVGKGKPSKEQSKAMEEAGDDWAKTTGDAADLLDAIAQTAKDALAAWQATKKAVT